MSRQTTRQKTRCDWNHKVHQPQKHRPASNQRNSLQCYSRLIFYNGCVYLTQLEVGYTQQGSHKYKNGIWGAEGDVLSLSNALSCWQWFNVIKVGIWNRFCKNCCASYLLCSNKWLHLTLKPVTFPLTCHISSSILREFKKKKPITQQIMGAKEWKQCNAVKLLERD